MSGLLGKAALVADTNTVLYTVPADTVTTLSVLMVNRGGQSLSFDVAVSNGSTPTDADFIEFKTALSASGVFERSGIVCSAGEKIIVNANAADCSVRVHGFEQGA